MLLCNSWDVEDDSDVFVSMMRKCEPLPSEQLQVLQGVDSAGDAKEYVI